MPLGVPWGSGCLVRAGHTGLSWGVTVGLFLHSTDLRRQKEQGELLQPLLFVSLVLCSLLLYFIVSLMDPGYVRNDGDEKEAVKEAQQAMIPQQVPTTARLRRCGYCLLKQPMRAKHCQACQHCVRRYDHHCLWIGNCVGEKNHPLFIVYLAVQLVVLLWALQVAWSGLTFELSWVWLRHSGLLLLSFLVIAVSSVVVTLLLVSHLYLASCNTTSWEFMSQHRISYLRHCKEENPFDQGVLRNLWLFFCACHLVAWEKLYFPEERDAV